VILLEHVFKHFEVRKRVTALNDVSVNIAKGELVSIIGLAGQTNHLVTAMQIPVDPEFEVK